MSKTTKKPVTPSTETFAVPFMEAVKGGKSKKVEGQNKPVNLPVTAWQTRHGQTACGSRDTRVIVMLDRETNIITIETTADIPAGTVVCHLVALPVSPTDVMRVQRSLVDVGIADKLNAQAQEEETLRVAKMGASKSAKELWAYGFDGKAVTKALIHKYNLDEKTAREISAMAKPASE